MCVSAALRDPAGAAFLGAASESTTILAGILSIIQPDLYNVGMAGFSRLWADPSLVPTPVVLREVLTLWSTPFNGVSVISNRSTPLHLKDIEASSFAGRSSYMSEASESGLGKLGTTLIGLP